jgi:hypothetical protein
MAQYLKNYRSRTSSQWQDSQFLIEWALHLGLMRLMAHSMSFRIKPYPWTQALPCTNESSIDSSWRHHDRLLQPA